MNGGIYSDQKCPLCKARFYDNFKNALICPEHHEQHASRFRVYFKDTSKRFKSYDEAARHLTGLRFKADEGTFKAKDYRGDLPLSFRKLAEQWLVLQKPEVKPATYSKNKCHLNRAIDYWNDKNVENFKKRDFQLFLNEALAEYSSKSKHNYLADIKQFFQWLVDNDDIIKMPKFPKVKYTLARRNTVDKITQERIIEEVYRLAKPVNIKIFIGVKFLATYFNTRPGELLEVKEKDIDLEQKRILIQYTKTNEEKYIYLLDEDVELLKELLKGFPKGIGNYKDLHFFRHLKGMKGIPENKRFGKHFFSDYWKRACKNLKIENVDLYGGTRHSSVQGLRKNGLSPEQIKLASGHITNRAFSRYFELSEDDLRKTYSLTRRQRTGKGMAKGVKSVNA